MSAGRHWPPNRAVALALLFYATQLKKNIMKKSLITIAVLGAMSSAALAQSNVTIYGLLDAGVVSERGGAAGSVTKLTGGVASASRLGFKGNEDLGGGLSALFVLEEGVLIDTGAQDSTGQAFNRQSYVGLSSKTAGTITLGRQYTMLYNAIQQVGDPFGAGYAGTAKNLFPVAGAEIRANNAVVYSTPNINGFSGDAMYSLGEQNGNNTAGRQFGLGLNYANGPLNTRLIYNNKNSDTSANNNVTPVVPASATTSAATCCSPPTTTSASPRATSCSVRTRASTARLCTTRPPNHSAPCSILAWTATTC